MQHETARSGAATPIRSLLWLQSLVLVVSGLGLYALPSELAPLWPWELPPLAARFIGASFLGIGVGVAIIVARPSPGARLVLVAFGIGMLLAPVAGLLTPDAGLDPLRLAGLGLVLLAFAALDVAAALGRIGTLWDDLSGVGHAKGRGRPAVLRAFFAIHLALVTPVGLAMLLVPDAVGDLWPWELTTVNLRLVGSIFAGSIPVSALALVAQSLRDVRPTLAAYAVFSTLALVAVAIHFALFDPELLRTWLFIALYAFVAAGSILALLAPTLGRRSG
jgi:hypothetical protein